jgi:predicted GIY-YIG superfamily endonuclease
MQPRLTTRRSVRIPDYWRETRDLDEVDYASRWHFLAMLLFCAANGRWDGFLRHATARCSSDVPDPDGCLRQLAEAGLIARSEDGWQITDVRTYLPSPAMIKDRHRRDTTHILYRIFGADDELLYVGRTSDLRDRLGQHARVQPWWHEVVRTAEERLPSFGELVIAEKHAIVTERPKYNAHWNGDVRVL